LADLKTHPKAGT